MLIRGNHGEIVWVKQDNWFSNVVMDNYHLDNINGDPFYWRSTDSGSVTEVHGLDAINSSWNDEVINDARLSHHPATDSSHITFLTKYLSDQTSTNALVDILFYSRR